MVLPSLTPGVFTQWLNSFDRHFQSVWCLLLNMSGERKLVIRKHYLRGLIPWNDIQGFLSNPQSATSRVSIKPKIFTLSFPYLKRLRDGAMNEYSCFLIHLTYSKLQLALGVTIYKADAPYSNHILILHLPPPPTHNSLDGYGATVGWGEPILLHLSPNCTDSGHLRMHCVVLCCAESLSRVWLFAIPWTVARQAPLSVGILQARILEWVAKPSSRGSSQPRDRT